MIDRYGMLANVLRSQRPFKKKKKGETKYSFTYVNTCAQSHTRKHAETDCGLCCHNKQSGG